MTSPERALAGKTALITGGTSGIGLATARALARNGAAVTVVGHREAKGQRALERLAKEAGEGRSNYLRADLSSMAGVRSLAKKLHHQHEHLDLLLNNAGGYFLRRRLTPEGFERTFALNHLAPFLLTHLLLDLVRAAEEPRIITTASGSHRGASIRFEDLHFQKGYRPWAAYGQSKLANVLFTKELARRLRPEGIPANCFHPGFVSTEIAQDNPLIRPIVRPLLAIFGKSPTEGARTAVYLATAPEAAEFSGEYCVDERPTKAELPDDEPQVSRRLWDRSEALVGLEPELRLQLPS